MSDDHRSEDNISTDGQPVARRVADKKTLVLFLQIWEQITQSLV